MFGIKEKENKRDGCTDIKECKKEPVSHESDSAEKGFCTSNPSLVISITLITGLNLLGIYGNKVCCWLSASFPTL